MFPENKKDYHPSNHPNNIIISRSMNSYRIQKTTNEKEETQTVTISVYSIFEICIDLLLSRLSYSLGFFFFLDLIIASFTLVLLSNG